MTPTPVPPITILIVSPVDLDLVRTETIAVQGTLDRPAASVLVNGVLATISGGAFSATVPLAEGTNEITVTARDALDRVTTASVQVVRDATPPTIVGSRAPAANVDGWTNVDVAVTFACDDALSGVAVCTGPTTLTGEGANQAWVGTATDRAGNSAQATVGGISIDKTGPAVSIAAPIEGAIVRAPRLIVAGSATDLLAGVARVTCNGVVAALSPDGFTCEVSLAEGTSTIVVEAADRAGNARATSVGVTFVSVPVVTISSPAHRDLFGLSPVLVAGSVDRPVTSVIVNGVAATLVDRAFTATVPLHEGNNLVSAVARDAAGGVGTGTISVALDSTPPRIAISAPHTDLVTSSATVEVAGSVNDTVVGTVNSSEVVVAVNGRPAQVANRAFALAGVALAPGANTITVTATDRAGNVAEATTEVVRREIVGRAQLRLVSGDGQRGPIGAELPAPLVVALTDESGQPAAGRTVVFKVTENDGALTSGAAPVRAVAAVTDGQGRAQVRWTLGARAGAGNNAVEAKATGFAGAALFRAGGLAAAPAKINVDAGALQVGTVGQPLARPFVAVVTDDGHNRLPGVPVTFRVVAGSGGFNGPPEFTAETDSDGRALATLTLGPAEGIENNVVEATFAGNAASVAAFTASGWVEGPPENTSISGVVLDNSNVPLKGAVVRVPGDSPATTLVATTNDQGQFSLKPAPVGHVLLHVDGSAIERPGKWPDLEFELVTVPGRDNTVGMPIYLLPIDTANQLCVTETTGGKLTLPQVPGFELTVLPGSATFTNGSRRGCVSVTPVHSDKVPMVPQFGQQPRFIVTIQPAGVKFDPPAPLTIPNIDGLRPGEVTEMYSFDHDLGQFVSIGTGHVSDDGSVLMSDPGIGIIKGGWHCGGNPSATGAAQNAHVSIAPRQLTLSVGEQRTVTATGGPLPSGTPAYHWSSSNGGIADFIFSPGTGSQTHPSTVVIRAYSPGMVRISVTYKCDSGHIATDFIDVTVIDWHIEIDAPQTEWYISAVPDMPGISARARVIGLDPDPTANIQFTWIVSVESPVGAPCNLLRSVSHTATLSLQGGSFVLPTTFPVVGGKVRLTARASIGGVPRERTIDTLWVGVTNPGESAISSEIDSAISGTLERKIMKAIISLESNNRQADSNSSAIGSKARCPLVRNSSRDVGLGQIKSSGEPGVNYFWDWKANIRRAVTIFQSKESSVNNLPHNVSLSSGFITLRDAYNLSAGRTVGAPVVVPPLETSSDPSQLCQHELDWIRLYNGAQGTDPVSGSPPPGLHEFTLRLTATGALDVQVQGGTHTTSWRRVTQAERTTWGGANPGYVDAVLNRMSAVTVCAAGQ